MRTRSVFLILILLSPPSIASATDLNQQTLKAWGDYIQATSARFQQRLTGSSYFLKVDETPDIRERLRQGEILVEPASKDIPTKVPQGLIHDWVGSAFIPNASMNTVFSILSDYDRYGQFFNPAVIDAKLLDEQGQNRKFSLLIQEKAPFVNAAIKSEYTSQTTRVNDHCWYTISYSTKIQQIDDYGQPGQHELPPDKGAGFVWRLYSIQKFEERDGGVYTELEAIALSRNVPFELQWIVRPIMQRLPRNSMVGTLEKTRNAICAEGNPNASNDCGPGAVTAKNQHGSAQRAPAATAVIPHTYR